MTSTQDLQKNLQKAFSNTLQDITSFANILEALLEDNKLQELDLPGETDGDRLKSLIYLPIEKGGLGSDIEFVDHLVKHYPKVHSKLRKVYGTRNKKDDKIGTVEVNLDPKEKLYEPSEEVIARAEAEKAQMDAAKPKKKGKNKRADSPVTDQQVSRDNATERAKEAIPVLEELINEGLVAKTDAVKLGKKIKDRDNPTSAEQEIMDKQYQVAQELEELKSQYGDLSSLSAEQQQEFKKEAKEIVASAVGKTNSKKQISLKSVGETAKDLTSYYSTEEVKELIELLSASLNQNNVVKLKSQPKAA